MTEAQRHQILLELTAQTGFITVEKVIERLGFPRDGTTRYQQAG